jgi:hypothetical protein
MSSKRRIADDEEEEFSDEDAKKPKREAPKKENKASKPTAKPGGDVLFELGGKKKVSVGKFKGMTLINIREYYEDRATGEEKVMQLKQHDFHVHDDIVF